MTENQPLVAVENFEAEVTQAICVYDKYVVFIDRPTEEFDEDLRTLLKAAVDIFNKRKPNQTHGISCNAYLTVIITGNCGTPYCGIYFNLKSPFISLKGESLI